MAATGKWYGLAIRDQWGASGAAADRVDYLNDTIKASLHTVTYAVDQDTHDYFNDVTNELAASGNYAQITLAGKTLTYDGPSNTVRFKCNNIVWTNLTPSAAFRYMVVRKDTGTASTSHLMSYVDMGADQSPSGIDFQVTPDATDGLMRGVVS